MKCVMLSIRPKYCELIASGKKTVEVRKTKPKIAVPFKCYIYCTKNGNSLIKDDISTTIGFIAKNGGKVIGEFVCDRVVRFENDCYTPAFDETADLSCLGYKELYDYLGEKECGYGWHITDLVIYEQPKELSEFEKVCQNVTCSLCEYAVRKEGYLVDCEKGLKRPPQSWCYCFEKNRTFY